MHSRAGGPPKSVQRKNMVTKPISKSHFFCVRKIKVYEKLTTTTLSTKHACDCSAATCSDTGSSMFEVALNLSVRPFYNAPPALPWSAVTAGQPQSRPQVPPESPPVPAKCSKRAVNYKHNVKTFLRNKMISYIAAHLHTKSMGRGPTKCKAGSASPQMAYNVQQ